jgi:hypothetical protein
MEIMIDKGEWERGDVYKRIKFNVSNECENSIDWFFRKLNERYFAIQK